MRTTHTILRDRVALVTGAGSGIGRASADILASEGAFVVVADRSADAARQTVELITGRGQQAQAIVADVGDESSLHRLVASALAEHGRIDILHNHAGVQVSGALEHVAVSDFERSFDINVRAHFITAKLVVPGMKARGGGVIVNTSSSSGVLYDREMIAYTTSKHAVIAMTRQMALDYARFNVRVNALCPGWVDTPFNDPFIRQMGGRETTEAYVKDRIPMGRWGRLDEMAQAVLFLASDRSSYMTGQALVIDGGETIK